MSYDLSTMEVVHHSPTLLPLETIPMANALRVEKYVPTKLTPAVKMIPEPIPTQTP